MTSFFLNRNLPLISFTGVWGVTLFLYFANPYKYDIISLENQLIIYLSILSTVLGLILAEMIIRRGNILLIEHENYDKKNFYEFNIKSVTSILKLCFIFIVIGIILELMVLDDLAGGLINYFSNPISARYLFVREVSKSASDWNLFHSFSNYLIDFSYIAAILSSISYVTDQSKKFYAFFPLILALIVSIITFQRYFLLQCFGLWFFGVLIISKLVDPELQKRALHNIKRIVIGVFLFFLIFSFLLLSVRLDLQKNGIKVKNVGEFIVESNYTYIAGNTVAFSNFLDKSEDHLYYGGSTFRNIFKWIARVGLIEDREVIEGNYTFTSIGRSSVNTFSYMRIFYEDFGTFGLFFFSFLWGFLGNLLYQNIFKSFSLWKFYIVLLFIYSYFLSFYSLTLISITLNILILSIIVIFEYIFYKPHKIYQLVGN